MALTNNTPSLAKKKAFIAKSRSTNYRSSLRLEGIAASPVNSHNTESKATVIARHRARNDR